MKYVDEFRNPLAILSLVETIKETATKPWCLMEVCGGQTHAILEHGLQTLLGDTVRLVHGPGCPVCVTPAGLIDAAVQLTLAQKVIMTTFGDMIRVPGSHMSLLAARAQGADVRVVKSPEEAVTLASQHPDCDVVFFGVGFETTAPLNALAIKLAHAQGLQNFSLLAAHVTVPPAIEAIVRDPQCMIDGFLLAGHVCVIMGYHQYLPLAKKIHKPMVVTGFEPTDVLQGILACIRLLEAGTTDTVDNQYARLVTKQGNQTAQVLLQDVFIPATQAWRGMGTIADSGFAIRDRYRAYDAKHKYNINVSEIDNAGCIIGDIMSGHARPTDCEKFCRECTLQRPIGPGMVSGDGACAAYAKYHTS